MAKPLIIGNWKSYVNSFKEGKELMKGIEKKLPRTLKTYIVLCPSFPLLDALSRPYRGTRIHFGAQDMFYEDGAHTGEVSPRMVKDTKAKYVIVGHAERRALGETDEVVARKVGAALDVKLTPIVAVGETERDKDGRYFDELRTSVLDSLALVDEKTLKKIVIAYEPVWAIGASLAPDARVIRETIIFIRKVLAERFDRKEALKARIIYGGAVTPETAPELITDSGANGFLLGRAAVDAEQFIAVVNAYHAK